MSKPFNESFTCHESFTSILPQYDAFILDQFGVLHNGTNALEGATQCVSTLYNEGKKLIILSNTSASSAATITKLPKLGFDPNHVIGAVTSGEEAAHHIVSKYGNDDAKKQGKKKALWFTWKYPKSPSPYKDFFALCGDNVEPAESVEDADFMITHGSDCIRGPGEDGEAKEEMLDDFFVKGDLTYVDKVLKRALERGLEMVCANPDFVMVKPDGSKGHMPGKIAQRYEELGGSCTSFGKPHVPHFEACIRDLGLAKERVCHVGDSLHHDITGANDSAIPSVFVVGGVHREELSCELGSLPEKEKLEALFKKEGQTPTHVVPMFRL
jgi:ribonucleotide monophosphatase NagD (HAD superfamily)